MQCVCVFRLTVLLTSTLHVK